MDHVLSLIEQIYEAGARPDHWQTALTRLADAAGMADATMGGQTSAQVPLLISARTDPEYVRTYAQYYHARNPMQMAVFNQPVGRVMLDNMVVADGFRKGEFYNDWCKPQGYLSGSALNLAAAEGWRATLMMSGPKEHDEDSYRLFKTVAPHLIRAFQLNQILSDSQALGLGAMAALEYVDRGALIVDRGGRARPANAMAERMLALNDGLILKAGVLSCSVHSETIALGRAIANCALGKVDTNGASLMVSRSAGRSPLSLLCMRFPAGQWWPGFEPQAAMIFVTDRDMRMEQRNMRLRSRFGLTPAEAALAWEITRSGGRQDAAANRGVTLATARSQLSSIFDKTGVRRQAELVRLLLDTLDEPDRS